MKRFLIPTRVLVHALVIPLILSACGATPATPTANAVDLPGTIAAAAFTSIAGTQAAIPTATIQPTATITNTPAPTATFIPLSTLDAERTAAADAPAATDPCLNALLPAKLEGQPIKIRIDNPTKAGITVSVNLQQARPGGLCGYRSYALAAQQSLVINDLVEGCYSIWAWNPDPKDYFMVTNGTSCLNSSQAWAFDITKNSINLKDN